MCSGLAPEASGAGWLIPASFSLTDVGIVLVAQDRGDRRAGRGPMKTRRSDNVAENILDPCLPSYTETGTLYNHRVKKLSPSRRRVGPRPDQPLGLNLVPNIRYTPLSGRHASKPACPLRATSGLMQCSKDRPIRSPYWRVRAASKGCSNRGRLRFFD